MCLWSMWKIGCSVANEIIIKIYVVSLLAKRGLLMYKSRTEYWDWFLKEGDNQCMFVEGADCLKT